MDTEQEYQSERLKDFRDKAKTATKASDLIDLIDRPLLTTAGWLVHADNPGFIGAVKVDQHGNEWELRAGRRNRTIAGSLTPKRRPAKQTNLDSFKSAMSEVFMQPQMTVRKFQPDELPWQEIVTQI